MSKAFTREDDIGVEPILPKVSSLPPGVKNYITVDGARRLREELDQLIIERPKMLQSENAEDSMRDLQVINQRIAAINASLESAEVVSPPATPDDVVRFGAFVTVRNRAGEHLIYRIVGVDETDIDKGWVSWRSPIARALLNARVGQKIRFQFPAGEDELEIVSVKF